VTISPRSISSGCTVFQFLYHHKIVQIEIRHILKDIRSVPANELAVKSVLVRCLLVTLAVDTVSRVASTPRAQPSHILRIAGRVCPSASKP